MYTPSEQNIQYWFDIARQHEKYDEWYEWYNVAYRHITRISNKYEVKKATVAGVVAVISPQNKWENNIRDAEAIISGQLDKKMFVTKNRKQKAIDIIETENAIDIVSGNKVTSFYLNILLNTDFVTIDRHAIKIASSRGWVTNKDFNKQLSKYFRGKRYFEVCDMYKAVAERNNVSPSGLQAATWCLYRQFDFKEEV